LKRKITSKTLATKLGKLALTKKAYDIKILDLRKLTTITDFFVICSADSDTQVKAVADAIIEGSRNLVKDHGIKKEFRILNGYY